VCFDNLKDGSPVAHYLLSYASYEKLPIKLYLYKVDVLVLIFKCLMKANQRSSHNHRIMNMPRSSQVLEHHQMLSDGYEQNIS
jgi:hypothetical protein